MLNFKNFFVVACLLSCLIKVHAQVYPVQGSASLIPPYALRLSDYATSTSDRMVMNVLLADVTKAELHVRFRISIVGQNVKLETKPEYIGSSITMQGGIPLRLTNIELAEYFDPNHLNFSGISKNDFLKTGFLPEGFYQFCFEVYEYNRGVKISNTICAPAWLILNDPPLINLPMNGSKLKPLSPQNVILQWTPRHTGSPNAAFTTEYEVKMVEVWPANRNPNDAILTQPTIYETTTNSTTLVYGPDATQLEPGRTYAFRVQARAVTAAEQLDLFKNNGYSETVSFVYGDACDPPANIIAQAETPSRFTLQWDAATSQTGYTVQYRVKGQADANWYSTTSLLPSAEISGLQPSTTYEYEVMSTCGAFESTFGNIATITTPDISQQGYVCGVAPGDFNLDPSQLLPILKVGDIVNAGDFDVTITKVRGADGVFTGEGAVVVPFLNQVKGKVAFENITVNNDKRMVNGFMNLTGGGVEVVPSGVLNFMDQLSQTLNVVDSALNIARQYVTPVPDPNTFVADTLITVAGGINKVYKDVATGNIIVVDNSGKATAIPPGKDIALVDNNGKGVMVNKQGGVTSTTAALAAASAKREYNLSLTFAKTTNSKLGFDEQKLDPLKGNYEKLSEAYFVSWKAVTTKSVDAVQATYNGKDIDPSKIKFEQDGNAITPAVSGNAFTLSVNQVAEETPSSIIAKTTGTDGKEQILGKLNIVGYADKPMKLQIVKVNNATFTADATFVKAQLDQVYAQANVTWDVAVSAQALQVNDLANPFDDGGSGLLSNYTGDMKTVINAAGELTDDTYYLFLVDQPASGNKLGYMPRSKRAGFIFTGPHGNDVTRMITTMAHELGHGAFTLKHTFADYTSLPQGSTDNLMDYNNGTQLWKYQWDQVHNPAIVLGLFESDEAGASISVNNIESLAKFKNKDGSLTFLSIGGRPITIKGGLEQVSFVSAEDKWSIAQSNLPLGVVTDFTVSGKKYISIKQGNDFAGYRFGADEYYIDEISQKKEYQYVLVGIPCWKNLSVKFRVFPTTYLDKNAAFKNVTSLNKGEGTVKDMYFITDYLEKESEGVDIYGQFDITYSNDDLFFIDEQTNGRDVCGKEALQLFNLVYLVHKNPGLGNCIPDALSDMGSMVQNEMRLEYLQSSSGISPQDATYVKKTPLAVQDESKRYSEEYKTKFKEQYLFNLNAAFTRYDQIISAKKFDDLDSKSISDIVEFLAVKQVKGRLCLLRNIPLDLRIKLINKHSEWTLSDNKEELVADLIETIPDSDISKFVGFLKDSNYALFWSLYNDLHMSEYDRFIFAITLQLMKSTGPPSLPWPNDAIPPPRDNPSKCLYIGKGTRYPNEWTSSSISYKSSSGIRVGMSSSGPVDQWGNTWYSTYYDGDPFEYVRIRFIDDYQLPNVKTGDKISSGQDIIVPAIWVYWLIDKQKSIEDFATIRVVLNVAAAGVSVLTMEPGPLLAVELLANGTDIVFAVNEDKILSSGSETSKNILATWNVVYGVYGAGLITKSIVNGVARFSFNNIAFKNITQSIRTSPQKLNELATSLYGFALKIGSEGITFNGRALLRTLVLKAYMEARLLTNTLDLASTSKLFVNQGDNLVFGIFVNGAYKEFATGKTLLNNDGTLLLSELRWYDPSVYGEIDNTICELNNVNYVGKAGDNTTGNLKIVVTKNGQICVRLSDNWLAKYPNIRKNLGNSWVLQYLNNAEYLGSDLIKKQLNVNYFQNVLTSASEDVLKYINDLDEFDFASMASGYRDIINNGKIETFENALKTIEGFSGSRGWFSYWKLTPSIKYGITTIEDLSSAGKLLPVGDATLLQLGTLQAFTQNGDFINIPKRYNMSYFGQYAEAGFNNVTKCLDELRKVSSRNFAGKTVFSGKAFSIADFESKFVNGIGKQIEYESFISTTIKQPVAEGFTELTIKWAGDGEKIAVIQRIVSKDGVYIDDISDWGKNLGRTRHTNDPINIQIQEEVLLKPSKLVQTAEPIAIMENGVQKTILYTENGVQKTMKVYYVDFTQQ
jgi:TANFOR domain-containing protein